MKEVILFPYLRDTHRYGAYLFPTLSSRKWNLLPQPISSIWTHFVKRSWNRRKNGHVRMCLCYILRQSSSLIAFVLISNAFWVYVEVKLILLNCKWTNILTICTSRRPSRRDSKQLRKPILKSWILHFYSLSFEWGHMVYCGTTLQADKKSMPSCR